MTTCPSCGIAGNNFNCPNHTYWSINPLPDSIPTPKQSPIDLSPYIDEEKKWLFAETGRLHLSLSKANKEIERLKGLMPPDERGPGFVGQGSWSVFAEKVVAERDFLRNQIDEYIALIEDLRKKGIIDQHNRPLPLEGHHKDCGHGKDGWSLCTCDGLKRVDEERASKQFKDLVEEGQNLRKEFDKQTAGMRVPPQCSKCGDTGIILAHDARGMRHCDCKKYVPPLARRER